MRRIVVMALLVSQAVWAQVEISVHDTVRQYTLDKGVVGAKTFQLPVNFDQHNLLQLVPDSLKTLAVLRIDLVYTTFKSTPDFDQQGLNNKRLKRLFDNWPLAQNDLIEWRMYAQDGAVTANEARNYFHGFTVYYRPTPTEASIKEEIAFLDGIFEDALEAPKTDAVDGIAEVKPVPEYALAVGKTGERYGETEFSEKLTSLLIEKGGECIMQYTRLFDKKRKPRKEFTDSLKALENVTIISSSYTGVFIRSSRSITWQEQLDSCPEVIKAPIFIRPEEIERELTMPDWLNSADYGVVESVFKRNPEWKNTLIVMDVTGSMSPYIAKTMAWVRATQKSDVVAAFTFFNDGDAKRGAMKIVGKTGGIYSVDNTDFAEVYGEMKATMRRGGGGDCPENNIEATIKTISAYPDFDEVVMLADNFATPRDLSLVGKITKPVHVILCGAGGGINIEYIQLAYDTGGTVHTIEDDMDMRDIKEGVQFKIGRSYFTLSKGRIVKAKHKA